MRGNGYLLSRVLRNLALGLAGALALAGGPAPAGADGSLEIGAAVLAHVDPPHGPGSVRAPDAPESSAALTGGQPSISQNPGGRPAGFDLRDPSSGVVDGPRALFGIRRRGVDFPADPSWPAHAQHQRLLRIGATSSFTTSLPPPPLA